MLILKKGNQENVKNKQACITEKVWLNIFFRSQIFNIHLSEGLWILHAWKFKIGPCRIIV